MNGAKDLTNARAIQVGEGGDASFLTKEIKHEAYTAVMTDLAKNIERFSGNLNYSDPEVYGKATNLAISTRVKPLENQAKALWYQVEAMLDDMFKGITEYWNKRAGSLGWDWRKLHYVYKLDKPINEVEIADTAVKYREVGLSMDTVVKQIPFVRDAQEEITKIKKENADIGLLNAPNPKEDSLDNL
jgi:SPP1 family phage portal protein